MTENRLSANFLSEKTYNVKSLNSMFKLLTKKD